MQNTTHKITAVNDQTSKPEVLFSGTYELCVRQMDAQFGDWNLDFSDIELTETTGMFTIVAERDDESSYATMARSRTLEGLNNRLNRDGNLWVSLGWEQLFIERTDGSRVRRSDLPSNLRGSELYWLCD